MYWPPATPTVGANITSTNEQPFVVETLGTTLTSPTIYVSYRSLYATDGCGEKVGTPVFNKIVAIPPQSTLSSIWVWPLGGAAVFYHGGDVITSTASVNITDLQEPVPMSIYSSQPFCASYAQQNAESFVESSWSCPHDSPYKPIIKVPPNLLQELQVECAECAESYGGAYDTPKALKPAGTIAVPTEPSDNGEVTSTPAAEASKPSPNTAESTHLATQVTGGPKQTKTSASTEDHAPADLTPTRSSDESTDDPTKSIEEHQSRQTVIPTKPKGQHEDDGEKPSDEDPVSQADARPTVAQASTTDPASPETTPGRPVGVSAMSILESALQATVNQIRPYTKESQTEASEDPQSSLTHDDPKPAEHHVVTSATEGGSPAGILAIGSDFYSQVQAPSGAAVIANAHSTVMLSPGGPAGKIGLHTISAVAPDIFAFGSGADRFTTSLLLQESSATNGQSLATATAGPDSVHTNADDKGEWTIGDQTLPKALLMAP
jgi:hypothetical protein